jgi:hypothetical protein
MIEMRDHESKSSTNGPTQALLCAWVAQVCRVRIEAVRIEGNGVSLSDSRGHVHNEGNGH